MATQSADRPKQSELDRLFENVERMSRNEQKREIEKAAAFLRANRIDSLSRFDEWIRQ